MSEEGSKTVSKFIYCSWSANLAINCIWVNVASNVKRAINSFRRDKPCHGYKINRTTGMYLIQEV